MKKYCGKNTARRLMVFLVAAAVCFSSVTTFALDDDSPQDSGIEILAEDTADDSLEPLESTVEPTQEEPEPIVPEDDEAEPVTLPEPEARGDEDGDEESESTIEEERQESLFDATNSLLDTFDFLFGDGTEEAEEEAGYYPAETQQDIVDAIAAIAAQEDKSGRIELKNDIDVSAAITVPGDARVVLDGGTQQYALNWTGSATNGRLLVQTATSSPVANAALVLRNLVLRNAPQGAIQVTYRLEADNIAAEGNGNFDYFYAAIHSQADTTEYIQISNSHFEGNKSWHGGAIFSEGAGTTVSITNSSFTGNEAQSCSLAREMRNFRTKNEKNARDLKGI